MITYVTRRGTEDLQFCTWNTRSRHPYEIFGLIILVARERSENNG